MNQKLQDEFKRLMNMSDAEQDEFFESLPPDGTSTLLVEDLLAKPESEGRNQLIERAKALEFDDFKSPHIVCKAILCRELARLGYDDLELNVKQGKYD